MSLDPSVAATDSQAGSESARRSSRRRPAQKKTRVGYTRASRLEEYEAALIKLGTRGRWEAEIHFLKQVLSS